MSDVHLYFFSEKYDDWAKLFTQLALELERKGNPSVHAVNVQADEFGISIDVYVAEGGPE